MIKSAPSPLIDFNLLSELEQGFQKNLSELIDLYLKDAIRKIEQLQKAYQDKNFKSILNAAKELRNRSMDVGAIKFSFNCLSLELAIQEHRSETVPQLINVICRNFEQVSSELCRIKHKFNNT